jgi:thiosulfate/3-mercaptopyruvate sulfurtransferase
VSQNFPALVSTEWLAARLNQPGLRVLDGSWYLPNSGRDPRAEYAGSHIPGAVFFDLDATSDQTTSLPHMLPTEADFAEAMSRLGLHDSDALVVYDGSGVNLSAPRVWWTFRVFGHEEIAVLDGGFGKWEREGRTVESGQVRLPRGRFSARLDPARVRDLASILGNIETGAEQVLDLRSPGRFEGTEPEPRTGLRGGHIPGSRNLPFTELVTSEGTLLPRDRLREKIVASGTDLSRPIVATCGSGTSACALLHALHLLGHRNTALYDGAWTEWGGREDTPVERGPAR